VVVPRRENQHRSVSPGENNNGAACIMRRRSLHVIA